MSTNISLTRKVVKAAIAPVRETSIAVDMKKDEIRKQAYELSTLKRSYNDYVWLWAESELRLANAYQTDLKSTPAVVKVDLKKVVEKPAEADIKKIASDLFGKRQKVQDIHWYIAERNYIFDAAKARK